MILISLAFMFFSSCSKDGEPDMYVKQVTYAREVVESAASHRVSVSEVSESKGLVTFSLSDGKSFTFPDSLVPFVQVGLDGYWYLNGEISNKKWGECDGVEVAASRAGAASAQHAGETETMVCIDSVVEGFTDWTFNFTDRPSISLIKEIHSFDYDSILRGVNHRGFSTVAPENTLPAFRLSRLEGFTYVETDVQFTKDGIPVCIHDETVDRTSDGSGAVREMTLAQLRNLDFGSWKKERFTGTKIPTLEEFLDLCRSIGLIPYIELKTGDLDRISLVISLVEEYGLKDKAIYMSFSPSLLVIVLACDPGARIGFVSSQIDENALGKARELKRLVSDDTKVFIASSDYSDKAVSLCRNDGFPLEIWTIDSAKTILSMPAYVSGVFSNYLHAGRIKKDHSKK